MAVAQGPFLAAVLLLLSSGLHCCSPLPACPESCTCHGAPLLNCSSTGLSSVPQHIQDTVTDIDLSHNLLDSVTLDRPHHSLRNVWLGNNRITHLSLCIERNLGSHYVRGRHRHRLRRQGCVSWAPTLQLLSVERNQLEQLPQGLEGSESLQVLQLSFNRISTLRPGDINHLQQLKELHLQHNLITSLHPQMFQDLAELRVLDLSFNMLSSLHPLMYLSLRNIGADVRLGGNRWQCDCSMRTLRRRMAYDSSRGLQAWRVVCASPSILSGRDLLQLEEDELNCFSTENRPELHHDVTVHSGSEILLSCSTQDSIWWMPSGQASESQPQAGLLITDITERDTGLYVCVSEEHEVVSIFNLQISKIGGARRRTRSLPRTSQHIIPQGTSNRIGQERNQTVTQSNLALAVCLSVFITFLIAFILGVLARPCIDVLWRRITKKERSSVTNSVSSVEQRQYDNEAYSNGEEQEHTGTHRGRRVTFSTVDLREDSNVQYYDTVAGGNQESISNDAVIECEAAEVVRDTNTTVDSGSENSLRQSSPEDNQRDGTDLSGITGAGPTHSIEFEHIPDPVELEKRRSLSSCSDSSLSDKVFNGDQMTPKSRQLAEDFVQHRADYSTAKKVEVPQISIEGTSELPGFSSEPFADWSPHLNNTSLTDPDLWQENEEQFEFSDSVRGTSARSSSVCGSFNEPKLIVAPTSDKHKTDDISSSSSYVSEDEPTQYTVNSDHEEEDLERNHNHSEVTNAYLKRDASFEQQIHSIEPIKRSVQFNQGDYRYDTQRPAVRPGDSFSSHSSDSDGEHYTVKKGRVSSLADTSHGKSLYTGAPSPSAAYSPSSSSESDVEITNLKVEHNAGKVNERISDSSSSDEGMDETTKHTKQEQREMDMAGLPIKEYHSVSQDAMKAQLPSLDHGHAMTIKRPMDIRAPSPPTDSSSSSESADETVDHMQEQGETHKTTLPIKVSQTVSHDSDTQWPALDLDNATRIKRRLDIKAPSPGSDSSSSSDSEDDTTSHTEKRRLGKVDTAGLPFQESQTESQDPHTRWPALDLEHTTRIKRRLDIKAPSPPPASCSSSDSEDETTNHIKKREQEQMNMARLPSKVSQTVSYDPQTQWPALDLEHSTRIKRRLDIKAPSPPPASCSSSDSEDETTNHKKKQEKGQMNMARLPSKVSQTVSYDPQTQWPALDLEHTTRIKRRLDIKAPSPPSASCSSSDSEDETTHHTERPGEVDMAGLPFQESQTEGHDPDTWWPALDLEHTMRIKRRLDIKAPSLASDSSSSSDSEDETTNQIKKQKQGEMAMARLPSEVSQTASYDPQTQWPALDLEHTMCVKRRLDIKAPSPPPGSCSSSDSEDETTNHIKKREQEQMNMARLPSKVSQTVSYDPQTQWPALDLEHTMRIKRRLDIKAPSPPPGSCSSSDSEDEITNHKKKQKQEQMNMARLPSKVSQTVSYDPQTQWPALDLEHSTRIKRRLDIKAPSPPPASCSSSDSEDETTNHKKKQEKGQMNMARLPSKVSQTVSYDPQTQWPALDLEHTMRVKRRLDIKAPSPPPGSSSSSDSEDETTNHKKKQEQEQMNMARLPFQESQTEGHDPDTWWPALDLEHTMRIKRRLDIKAPSLASDSSSSSDSEDETTNQIKKQEQGEMAMAKLPSEISQTASYDPQTQWPALDLEHTMRVKRRLDIKAPSPAPDSSSSSDSEYETSSHIEKPLEVKTAELPFQKSQTVSHDPDTRWPSIDLGNITRIKRRLDIKAPSPPPDSEGKREEAIKISPCHSSSSSDEKEESVEDLIYPSTTVEPDSRWPELDLSSALRVKRRLDIKARSPPTESSSSSDERESGTTNLPVKVKRDRTDVWIKTHQPGRNLPDLKLSVPPVKRSLNVKAPSQQPDPVLSSVFPSSRQSESNSSRSDSEDEYRGHDKLGLGISAISKATEKEFIKAQKTPVINISHSPKTDHNVKLEKYTVVTDDVEDKTRDNISTTPKINPELQSRWATMNLGISRFRKRLEIASHTHEPPKLPSSPPPDSPTSSSSESGTGSKSSKIRQKRKGVGMQGSIHTESYLTPENKPVNVPRREAVIELKSQTSEGSDSVHPQLSPTNIPHAMRALDIRAPLQRKSSSSSNSEDETIDHSVPDLSLGVPLVKRRLNVKGPLPEPRNSPSSGSESENEVTRYTANQSRYASNMSGMTDNDDLITYKRLIIKASSPLSNSFSPGGRGQTLEHTKQRHTRVETVTVAQECSFHDVGDRGASLAPNKVPSMSFDDVVKRRIEQPRHSTDVDLPPEIRWTGIGRHLTDLSTPSSKRHLDVGLPSSQQATPAKPNLTPPDSSNSSSSESDGNIKQDREKTDVTPMHKHSSLSANSVSLATSRAFDTFDNSPSSTSEILRTVSEGRNERKGLSALKAMSSERRKWDMGDENLNKGLSPHFDDHGAQVDTSFNYRWSEEDTKPLAKQPLTQLHLASTSVDQERATDLLYGIHRNTKHNIGGIEPPQRAPPPIPATPPPPYEAVELTWSSPQSTKKQGLESTRFHQQQSRKKEVSKSSSLTSHNLAVYFDSSNVNISEV